MAVLEDNRRRQPEELPGLVPCLGGHRRRGRRAGVAAGLRRGREGRGWSGVRLAPRVRLLGPPRRRPRQRGAGALRGIR
eukprot:6636302-Pyramimonas_sp.AAC.1